MAFIFSQHNARLHNIINRYFTTSRLWYGSFFFSSKTFIIVSNQELFQRDILQNSNNKLLIQEPQKEKYNRYQGISLHTHTSAMCGENIEKTPLTEGCPSSRYLVELYQTNQHSKISLCKHSTKKHLPEMTQLYALKVGAINKQ